MPVLSRWESRQNRGEINVAIREGLAFGILMPESLPGFFHGRDDLLG